MDWFRFFQESYLLDTRHLTTQEHGAYLLLLLEYYRTRQPLPNDDRVLARITGLSAAEWAGVAPNIRAFFQLKTGLLHHKKVNEELDRQDRRSKGYSERAKKAANARHSSNNDLGASAEQERSKSGARAEHFGARVKSEEERVKSEERREEPEKKSGSGTETAPLDVFANKLHHEAYIAYRIEHGKPRDVDNTLRQVNAPITGGNRYEWPTIGDALVEMRGGQVRFTAAALRGFCQRLLRGPAPVGAKTPPGGHGGRQERNLAAIKQWAESVGGDDG